MRKLFYRVLPIWVFLQLRFDVMAKPSGGGGGGGAGFEPSMLIAPSIGAGIAMILWGIWYRYVAWRCPECKGRVWINPVRGGRKSVIGAVSLGVVRVFECSRCGTRFIKCFRFS